eukprot:CAMPEP_0115742376 /NCGR_PEP_ID=MMETSP0272-20121206/90495_1 /TAXON_ID=71861 /ORGANISM="Scrippsiella trochoidea, Strain CCMP3099" /LENGTH=31 /DNA_ID= /DNA_START= /DNA_END= /DNA_ORIENTATION=
MPTRARTAWRPRISAFDSPKYGAVQWPTKHV